MDIQRRLQELEKMAGTEPDSRIRKQYLREIRELNRRLRAMKKLPSASAPRIGPSTRLLARRKQVTGKFNPHLEQDQTVEDAIGQFFEARYVGVDPLTRKNIFEADADPRGPLGPEHLAAALVAEEYGMIGPDVWFSWGTLNNDLRTYQAALDLAMKQWKPKSEKQAARTVKSIQSPKSHDGGKMTRRHFSKQETEKEWDGSTTYLVVDGEIFEIDDVVTSYLPLVVTKDGREYYVAESQEDAEEAVKRMWRGYSNNEIIELITADVVVNEWVSGRTFENWLDSYLRIDGPELDLASYDGQEREVDMDKIAEIYGDEAYEASIDNIGFIPTVAYRAQ